MWFLSLILILQTIDASTVYFNATTNNSGLVFQQRNNIFFSSDEWRIVYFYDISPFYLETEKIKEIRQTILNICNNLNGQNNTKHVCSLIIRQLNQQQEHINTRDSIINSFENKKQRISRAPIEIIGTAAKYLFGVMDAEDAEKYNNEISKLKKDTAYMKDLTIQQTTLIERTISTQKTAISELQSHLISISTFMEEVANKTSYAYSELNSVAHFNTLSTAVTLMIIHHEELANKIFNLLTNTIHGKITDVIPSLHLKQNLREVALHLVHEKRLPINTETDNIYSIFKYTTIKSTLHDKKVIIELTIPITDIEPWTYYNTIALPIRKQSELFIINSNHRHFFTDKQHKQFLPVDEAAFKKCIAVNEKMICKIHGEIISTEKNCELTILDDLNIKLIPKECNVQPIFNKNYIIKITDQQYFLSTKEAYSIRTICNNENINIHIQTDGYLNVGPACKIISNIFTIKTPDTHIDPELVFIKPEFELSDLNITTHAENFKNPNFIIHNTNNNLEYDRLIEHAKDIKRKAENFQLTATHENKLKKFTIFSSSIILFSIIIFAIIIKYADIQHHNHATSTNTTAATAEAGEHQEQNAKKNIEYN